MICERRVRVANELVTLQHELKQYELQREDAMLIINAHTDPQNATTLKAMREAKPLKREADAMIGRIQERIGYLGSPPVKLGQREP